MKQFITILVLLMATLKAAADDFTLKGKVVDEEEHALELVTVSCPAQGKVTMTNLKGEFSLHLQSADSVEVRFSMIGYAPRKRVFRNPKKQLRIQIVMHPMKALQEVTVTQQRRQTGQTQNLNVKDLKQTPSTTGNAVEELIQQQAGVSTHNELSSQYNVRGGSFDENLVYINQVEVYRPMLVSSGQQEGLSIINPDMVEKIGFSTGGFEAKYGDKMSSALDITYRRVEGFEATASASLLGASGYLGVGNKRFSMLHGLRYKTNKYLLGSLETTGEYHPNFFDYQTYISYKPNNRWTVDFIGNISDNHYNFKPEDRESEEVRSKLLRLGISQVSGGSRTSVGGYTEKLRPHDTEQFDVSDQRTLDEVVAWLMQNGHIPSFCTACYREGRTGDRFMSLCKSGQILNCCHPNALMTLAEYLVDYASEETKQLGFAMIGKELKRIPKEKVRDIAEQNIRDIIMSNSRDFRF